MHIINLFCVLRLPIISLAHPIQAGSIASTSNESSNNKTSASSVSRAVDGLVQNAETVSQQLNALPSMKDRKQIQDSARTALDAEINQDSHRSVLAEAAGSAGSSSSDKITTFMPAILSGLNAIIQSGTAKSIMENIPTIQESRNSNILPSIMQLSIAALNALGIIDKPKMLPPKMLNNNINIKDNDKQNIRNKYNRILNSNVSPQDRNYDTNQNDRNDNAREDDRDCINRNDPNCNGNQDDWNNNNKNSENWNSDPDDEYIANRDHRDYINQKDKNNGPSQNDWDNANQDDWEHTSKDDGYSANQDDSSGKNRKDRDKNVNQNYRNDANQDEWSNADQDDWKISNKNEYPNKRKFVRNNQFR